MRDIIKQYPISMVFPGMLVAETVISPNGNIMLEAEARLTESNIRHLVVWGVTKIAVREFITEQDSRIEVTIPVKNAFAQAHEEIVIALKDSFEKIRYLKKVPVEQMIDLSKKCLNSLINKQDALQYLAAIQNTDDSTFRHSVNVSVLAGLLGKWVGLQGQELETIALTGLMHDVGKTQIPLEILTKPDKLSPTEMDCMKQHPSLGYNLLKRTCDFPSPVMKGVLYHHERNDGSGYPEGLTGDRIPKSAKIMAIADVYDAMTSNRVYQNAMTPFSAIAEFSNTMADKLDPEISSTFLDNFSKSLLGCIVMLSDYSTGMIVSIDPSHFDKPLLISLDGSRSTNLMDRQDLQIVGIIR